MLSCHTPPRHRIPRYYCGYSRWLIRYNCLFSANFTLDQYSNYNRYHNITTHKPMFTTSIYFSSPTFVKVTEIYQYPKKNTGSNEDHKPFSGGPLSAPQDLTTDKSVQWWRDTNTNKSTSNPFMQKTNFTHTETSTTSTSKSSFVPTFTTSIYSPSPTLKHQK